MELKDEELKQGAIVIVALPGDYGKPRPAVVIQSDYLTNAGHNSIIICPITGYLEDAEFIRIPVDPSSSNGLKKPSQIMSDKIFTIPLSKIGGVIGHLDQDTYLRLKRTLAIVIGLS